MTLSRHNVALYNFTEVDNYAVFIKAQCCTCQGALQHYIISLKLIIMLSLSRHTMQTAALYDFIEVACAVFMYCGENQ